ncbi:hypothetical protein [Streptomyces sp. 147326]|uniref:hypothetical protein n=1 Tax=Streptomyces sp. 147326 TaxID=3074379 RepID=UPI00385746BC
MANPMIDGKRADSVRRRARVLKALDTAVMAGGDITVSGLARAARVDRTFLYRTRTCSNVSTSLLAPRSRTDEWQQSAGFRSQTDLAYALERGQRLAARVRRLENRPSSQLGESVWADSGLGAPVDVDQLQRRITLLEQDLAHTKGELNERTEELEAARAANRELTRALNSSASG